MQQQEAIRGSPLENVPTHDWVVEWSGAGSCLGKVQALPPSPFPEQQSHTRQVMDPMTGPIFLKLIGAVILGSKAEIARSRNIIKTC